MKYRSGRNFCDCHPDTCNCSPWAVLCPDGKTFDTFWEKADADKIAKKLNKQVKLKREADGAIIMDVHRLRKLVKQLVSQLQV